MSKILEIFLFGIGRKQRRNISNDGSCLLLYLLFILGFLPKVFLKTFNFGFPPIGPESDKTGFAAWVQELHAAFSPKGIESTARNNF